MLKTIIISVAAIISAILSIFAFGKSSGEKQAQNKQNAETLNDIEKSNKALSSVNDLNADAQRDKLRHYSDNE